MAMSKERLEEAKLMSLWERGRKNGDVADMIGYLISEVERLQIIEARVTKGTQATKMHRQRTRGENSHGG